MSTAEQWADVLGAPAEERFTLQFDHLGLEARCRPLLAGEVEECIRMGGERGMRYALYLACDDLREAGESMKKQGAVATAFDITERLRYGDVLAAGTAILSRSGAQQTQVRLDGQIQSLPAAKALTVDGGATLFPPLSDGPLSGGGGSFVDPLIVEQNGWISAGQVARDFADRLWAAAGNR